MHFDSSISAARRISSSLSQAASPVWYKSINGTATLDYSKANVFLSLDILRQTAKYAFNTLFVITIFDRPQNKFFILKELIVSIKQSTTIFLHCCFNNAYPLFVTEFITSARLFRKDGLAHRIVQPFRFVASLTRSVSQRSSFDTRRRFNPLY